jgi:hypothetical protein
VTFAAYSANEDRLALRLHPIAPKEFPMATRNTNRSRNQDQKAESRDEANRNRFVEQSGLEASELPDKGRPTGHNDTVTDVGRRNLPQQHGGEMATDADDMTAEGGLRADRSFGGSRKAGNRGKN